MAVGSAAAAAAAPSAPSMKFSGIQNVISTKRTDKQKQTNSEQRTATKYYFSWLASFLQPCGQQEIPCHTNAYTYNYIFLYTYVHLHIPCLHSYAGGISWRNCAIIKYLQCTRSAERQRQAGLAGNCIFIKCSS